MALSAFGKASLAFRSFIGVVGVYSALELGRTVFEQVKALNGLNLALEQVTETQDRFNAAQVFVSEVADESGANIFELQSAYTKFLAAAKTTNLTSQQTNNIFRQVAKASGVLGLSTEATNGAFRALEQILSKGKVQAEEIRGQLGERLPGAFQILARSMGLTTAELSKQLELGNVLSDEVLPGFAAELEKTYNLNLVRRVETLAASQTRLGNAWKEFLNNVEGGEGTISRVFTSIFETLTKAVEFLDDLNKTTEETQAIYDEGLKSEAVQKELTEIKIKSLDAGVTMQQQARLLRADYILAHDDAAQRVSLLKDEIEKLEKKETSGRQEGQKRIKELNELNKELKAEQSNLVIKSGRLEAVNKLLKPATENVKGFKEEVKESKEELDDLTPRLERVFAILRGTSGEEAEKLRREIEGIVEALNSSGDGINVGISGVDVPNPSEVSEGLLATIKDSYSQINEDARVSAEEQMEIFRNVFDTFSQYYNLDLTAFQNLLSGKENSLQDYANTAKSIAQAITDSALIRFENERVANQEKLDAILNSDRVSEEQKQAAQRKFEEEDRKLRIKQAKAQRLATLIQIGIDTAAGIAKAVAASPLTFGQPFASVVAATGAIQAAFVAAQPLPQFFRGTQDAPQGYAWTDEKGAELHTDSKGNIKDLGSNKGARVKYLESGDKIYTANQTRDILKNSVTGDTELTQMKIDRLIMRKASNITVSSDGIKKEIRSGIKQGFAGIRFPVSNDNYSRY